MQSGQHSSYKLYKQDEGGYNILVWTNCLDLFGSDANKGICSYISSENNKEAKMGFCSLATEFE